MQSVAVLMAVCDEDAIHAHGVGGFSIMGRVADVDDVCWVEAQIMQVNTCPLGFAASMDITAAAGLDEVVR